MNRPLSAGEYAVGTFTHSLYNLRDEALETKSRRRYLISLLFRCAAVQIKMPRPDPL